MCIILIKETPGINDNDDVKMMTQSLEAQSVAEAGEWPRYAGSMRSTVESTTNTGITPSIASGRVPTITTGSILTRDGILVNQPHDHEFPHKHNGNNNDIIKDTFGINDNDDATTMTESLDQESQSILMMADLAAGKSTHETQSTKSGQKPSIVTTTDGSRNDHECPPVPHKLAQDQECEFDIDVRNFVGTWEKYRVVGDERNCYNNNRLGDAVYQIQFQTIGDPINEVLQCKFILPKHFLDAENKPYECRKIEKIANTLQISHFYGNALFIIRKYHNCNEYVLKEVNLYDGDVCWWYKKQSKEGQQNHVEK